MSETVLNVTGESFAAEVEAAATPVLVDFWAPWCQPCVRLSPTIEKLARDFEGKVRVVKVNVQEEPELADRFGISGIPALVVFQEGKVVDARVGAHPEPVLREMLNAHAPEVVLA